MALTDLLNSFGGVARTATASGLRSPATAAARPIPSGFGGFPGLVGGVSTASPTPAVAAPAAPAPYPPVAPRIDPGLLATLGNLTRIPPVVYQPVAQPRVATDLARRAVDQLSSAGDNLINEGIAAAHNAGVPAPNLMAFLARKVLIGEVLGGPADGWSEETRRDFAGSLNIGPDRQDVMNTIVSLAILSDPDLEEEIRGEHMTQPTEADLLGNRRVVWQYPPAGTPLQPPYVIVIAVEHQEVAQAQQTVDAILGELADRNGFRVPRPNVRLPFLAERLSIPADRLVMHRPTQ